MNRYTKYIASFLIIFLAQNAFTQEKVKVITSIEENNSGIIIKWYAKKVFTNNAVDVYRADANSDNWTKINQNPINKKDGDIPADLRKKDDALRAINGSLTGADANSLNGFLVLTVMIKSIEFPEFADYLGIQYIDKTAQKGKSYKYKITDTNGKTMGISEPITFTNFEKEDAPANTKVEIVDYIPHFSWQVDNNKFFGYNIYRSKTKNGDKHKINKDPIVPMKNKKGKYPDFLFKDDTMQIGDVYYYNIVGLDYFGKETKFSKDLVAIIRDKTPPEAPYGIKTYVTGTNVDIFWDCAVVDDLNGFNVYRSKSKNENFVKVNTKLINKNFRDYNDEVEDIGVVYYKVTSVDTAGNEAFSYVSPANITDVFPPETPKNVVCKADTGIIQIAWKANEESDLMGYYVYRTIRKTDDANFSLLNTEPVKTNNYIDTLPKQARNKFYYKIVAVDTSYNRSGYSDFAVIGMPDVTPPKKPVIKSAKAEGDKIIIEWFPNFETDLAGYNIYRKVKNDTINKKEKLNINTISKKTFVFTDIFADKGIEYQYSIVAFDTSGNYSDFSDEYTAILIDTVKTAKDFTNFKANFVKSKKQVKLTWKIKNPENLKGFMVYRKQGNNGQLKPITGIINENEYIDKQINTKKTGTYTYQIRGFAKNGMIIKTEKKEIKIEVENE